jgi:hypothetical protein
MDVLERKAERATKAALEQVGIRSRIKIMEKLTKEYNQYINEYHSTFTNKPTFRSNL